MFSTYEETLKALPFRWRLVGKEKTLSSLFQLGSKSSILLPYSFACVRSPIALQHLLYHFFYSISNPPASIPKASRQTDIEANSERKGRRALCVFTNHPSFLFSLRKEGNPDTCLSLMNLQGLVPTEQVGQKRDTTGSPYIKCPEVSSIEAGMG